MNNEKNRTHYRKVYKSDHLGIADLEDFTECGSNLIFTIKYVRQELAVAVAGKKGDHNIAYFQDTIKPLVINATNGKILKKFCDSPYVEDWVNIQVQLYINPNVKMRGETVGGVRINPTRPKARDEIMPGHRLWGNAVKSCKDNGNILKVLEHVNISPANQIELLKQAGIQ